MIRLFILYSIVLSINVMTAYAAIDLIPENIKKSEIDKNFMNYLFTENDEHLTPFSKEAVSPFIHAIDKHGTKAYEMAGKAEVSVHENRELSNDEYTGVLNLARMINYMKNREAGIFTETKPLIKYTK